MPLNEDDQLSQESPTESLQQTLRILIPIRRQRFNRAQRLQRQQQTQLAEAEAQQQAEERRLTQNQLHYQRQRERLQQQSCREKLTAQVNTERTALQAVGQQQLRCQQAEHACEHAASALAQASQHAHEQQKALEKLEYLSEHLEDV
ncbi:hypothetical protein [Pantoea agglomerans]|uniref:HrpO protein n=1 Tax=Enterobacter agglomerans TaxID=549 RepID=Q937I2_ENTAG|nr:hypothetical protein [Pantoea agglomerans]WHU90668.1 type III secretion system protein [Pantoea agglomerans pv. gypsophilae]CAC43016.1 HrpO protein [Pantoea agglomerans]